MHIVVIVDHAHVNGGQAKVALDSAIGLARRGHAVTVFAAVMPVDSRLAEAGVAVVCLDQPDVQSATSKLAFAVQQTWNRTAAVRLGALLATLPAGDSLVHVHGWARALSPSIGAPLRRSGLPVVYTFHDFFLVCPNGGFFEYPARRLCTRTPLSLSCIATNCDAQSHARKLWRVGRQIVLDRLSGLKDVTRHVIALSDLQESVVRPHMPPGTIWHRVDNPIDAQDLGRKPEEAPPGPFVFVGRLSPEKGADLFCEAATRLGAPSVVVGDGPMMAELKATYPADRAPHLTFAGWAEPDAARAAMRQARALVFPSILYEGQPLTVYEALALGTPVVVSDVCAGREAVVPGENGFLFRSQDRDDLVARMAALGDDALARRLSAQAHARYWDAPLTLSRHVDRLEAVYAQVMSETRRAA